MTGIVKNRNFNNRDIKLLGLLQQFKVYHTIGKFKFKFLISLAAENIRITVYVSIGNQKDNTTKNVVEERPPSSFFVFSFHSYSMNDNTIFKQKMIYRSKKIRRMNSGAV